MNKKRWMSLSVLFLATSALASNQYPEYINRFRSSLTKQNQHISTFVAPTHSVPQEMIRSGLGLGCRVVTANGDRALDYWENRVDQKGAKTVKNALLEKGIVKSIVAKYSDDASAYCDITTFNITTKDGYSVFVKYDYTPDLFPVQ